MYIRTHIYIYIYIHICTYFITIVHRIWPSPSPRHEVRKQSGAYELKESATGRQPISDPCPAQVTPPAQTQRDTLWL